MPKTLSAEPTATIKGAFSASLQRNNKEIKNDRAIQITKDAQLFYKREIEDLAVKLDKLRTEREGMMDLSPTDKNTLILASDFKAKEFAQKDISIGVEIRQLEIALEIGLERYEYLFGKKLLLNE